MTFHGAILAIATAVVLAGCGSESMSSTAPENAQPNGADANAPAVDTRAYSGAEISIAGVGGDHIVDFNRAPAPQHSSFFHAWNFELICSPTVCSGTDSSTIQIEQDSLYLVNATGIHYEARMAESVHAYFDPTRRVIDSLELRHDALKANDTIMGLHYYESDDNDTLIVRLRGIPYTLLADSSIRCELRRDILRNALIGITWSDYDYIERPGFPPFSTKRYLLLPPQLDTSAVIHITFRR